MAVIPIRDEPIPGKPGLTPLDGGGPKLIVHTTEVGLEWEADGRPGLIQRCRNHDLSAFAAIYNGVLASWKAGRGYPTQYLVDVPNRVVARCVPETVASYGLADLAGGVRTNRAGSRLLQMEVCGHAAQLEQEFTPADWRWFGDLLRQLCLTYGIPYAFPAPFATSPAPAYGLNAPQRLTSAQYQQAAGILGHQHVPENEHSDPGILRLDLMNGGGPTTMSTERRVLRFTHRPDDLFVGDLEWAADGSPVPFIVQNITLAQWEFYSQTLAPGIVDIDPARIGPCTCLGPTPDGSLIPTGTWPFRMVLTQATPAGSIPAHTHPELAPASHTHPTYSPTNHTHPAPLPAPHTHTIPATTTGPNTSPA